MKDPAASVQRAGGVLATKSWPKPCSGFFCISECRKVAKNTNGLKSSIRAGFAVHPLDLFQATYRKTLKYFKPRE
jgi:hypothetical protein